MAKHKHRSRKEDDHESHAKKSRKKDKKEEDDTEYIRKLFKYASSGGSSLKVLKLLNKGVHVNSTDSHGQTALHLVSFVGWLCQLSSSG